MRYYELLYIVNPNMEDGRVNNIIDEIGNEINKYKVSIINHHIWGKKRLAYPINKNKYGIYVILHFGAEQFDFLIEFERVLILNKSVIRHQLVRLDEEPAKVKDVEPVVGETDSSKEESLETPESDPTVDNKVAAEAEKVEEVADAEERKPENKQEIKEEDK